VDGTNLFTRNIGAGVFLRYAGGNVDLPSAENGPVFAPSSARTRQ
jgi:hypothetical protein